MDWEPTFDAIMLVAVLAIIVDRILSVLFQNRLFIERFDRDGMKETIASGVSVGPKRHQVREFQSKKERHHRQ